MKCDVMLPPIGQAVNSMGQAVSSTSTESVDKLHSRSRPAPDVQKLGLQERLDHLINLVRAPARRRKYAWPETVLAQQGADVHAKLPALAEDRAQVTPANLQTEEVLEGAYVSSDEMDNHSQGHGRANARAERRKYDDSRSTKMARRNLAENAKASAVNSREQDESHETSNAKVSAEVSADKPKYGEVWEQPPPDDFNDDWEEKCRLVKEAARARAQRRRDYAESLSQARPRKSKGHPQKRAGEGRKQQEQGKKRAEEGRAKDGTMSDAPRGDFTEQQKRAGEHEGEKRAEEGQEGRMKECAMSDAPRGNYKTQGCLPPVSEAHMRAEKTFKCPGVGARARHRRSSPCGKVKARAHNDGCSPLTHDRASGAAPVDERCSIREVAEVEAVNDRGAGAGCTGTMAVTASDGLRPAGLAKEGTEEWVGGGTKTAISKGVANAASANAASDRHASVLVIMNEARIGRRSAQTLLEACNFDVAEAVAVFQRALSRGPADTDTCGADESNRPHSGPSPHPVIPASGPGGHYEAKAEQGHISACVFDDAQEPVRSLRNVSNADRPRVLRKGSETGEQEDKIANSATTPGQHHKWDRSESLTGNCNREKTQEQTLPRRDEALQGSAVALLSACVRRWACRRWWVGAVAGSQVLSAAVRRLCVANVDRATRDCKVSAATRVGCVAAGGNGMDGLGERAREKEEEEEEMFEVFAWGVGAEGSGSITREILSEEAVAVAHLRACVMRARLNRVWLSKQAGAKVVSAASRRAGIRMQAQQGREQGDAGRRERRMEALECEGAQVGSGVDGWNGLRSAVASMDGTEDKASQLVPQQSGKASAPSPGQPEIELTRESALWATDSAVAVRRACVLRARAPAIRQMVVDAAEAIKILQACVLRCLLLTEFADKKRGARALAAAVRAGGVRPRNDAQRRRFREEEEEELMRREQQRMMAAERRAAGEQQRVAALLQKRGSLSGINSVDIAASRVSVCACMFVCVCVCVCVSTGVSVCVPVPTPPLR